jgi:hypothetical protein
MNPIQINPYVFGALVSILTMLLGLVLGNYLSSTGNAQRKLSDAVGKLDITVTRLDTTITGMEKLNSTLIDGCKERHERIDNEMRQIWNKIG